MSVKQVDAARVSLGDAKNGVAVWYEKSSSHAATHLRDTPGLEALVAEITAATELQAEYALAWGTQEIQPLTETNVCPW